MARSTSFAKLETPDWLRKQCLEGVLTITEMAREVGCTDGHICNTIRKFGLTYTRSPSEVGTERWRRSRDERLNNREWLVQNHDIEGRTATDIAEEIGCSPSTVISALARHGLASHEQGYRKRRALGKKRSIPQLEDGDWLRTQLATRTISEVAEELDCATNVVGSYAKQHGIEKVRKGRKRELRSDAIPQLADEAWLRREFIEKNRKTREIAEDLGCSFWSVQTSLYRFRIRKFPDRPTKKKDGSLPPGVREKGGYILVWKPDHPRANSRGYVMQHRLICEEILGRLLLAREEVHHLNEIRNDNRSDNLLIMKDHSAHVRFHDDPPAWVPRCECCGKPRPELVTARPADVPLEWPG